jgi:uncharacterized membrane protein YfcA
LDILIIIIASFAASLITLFSGFGLGTLLMPVFAIFFPIEIAVALTGIVHFLNNIFKVGLLGKYAQWKVVLQFGIPSVAGAFLGALTLLSLTHLEPIAQYQIGGANFFIQPIKLVIAVLMIYFAFAEMFPKLQSFTPPAKTLPLGGLLSGFFGGLSGHQGALRSAFLLRYGLEKEQFIATGVVIACFVDFTRLSMYSTQFLSSDSMQHWEIVGAAVVSAFIGAYAGNLLLKKITLAFIQKVVGILLFGIAVALGAGII